MPSFNFEISGQKPLVGPFYPYRSTGTARRRSRSCYEGAACLKYSLNLSVLYKIKRRILNLDIFHVPSALRSWTTIFSAADISR